MELFRDLGLGTRWVLGGHSDCFLMISCVRQDMAVCIENTDTRALKGGPVQPGRTQKGRRRSGAGPLVRRRRHIGIFIARCIGGLTWLFIRKCRHMPNITFKLRCGQAGVRNTVCPWQL